VLVGGSPGVGKTVLVDELRPVETGRGGWFVAGKFDEYRRDLEFDAVHQAFRALGRLLLAEPEDDLAEVRKRILEAVGLNAGLLTAVSPEFAALLAVPPDPGDPLTARVRVQRVAVDVLRVVASSERPVVVFVDDLQWAGRTPLGVVDIMLGEEPVEGLLLVGAYREDDVGAAHPLSAPLSRWREQPGVRCLRLVNLPTPCTATMVAEMLRVDPATAAGLAEVISLCTSGNPYETVELLNALRRHGLLMATALGWRWDAAAVRAHLDRSEAAGLPAGRVEAMPARSRRVVEAMACLGGRAELSMLQTAVGASLDMVEKALAPALDDGLLVMEPGSHPAMRFRHDRIREVVLRGVCPRRRRALHLAMARRLAAVPEWFAVAAEQYLPVVEAVEDPAERRRVVELLRRAAGQVALIGDSALVNALLTAALRLVDPGQTTTLIEVRTGRHAALYGLGCLEEADEDYRSIEELCTTALQAADATCVQVRSLTHRKRLAEAIDLGMQALRELGITIPDADRIPAELDHQFDYLYQWLDHTEGGDEPMRRDITDSRLLAATWVINTLVPANYFVADQAMLAWLSLEALRIWLEHGSARALLGPMMQLAFPVVALRGDYAAAYRAGRRILVLGEARGYEPDASQARFLFAYVSCWFEPIENGVQAARRAREGLIAGGDLANAGYTYVPTVQHLLDSAPSLDGYVAEVEEGLAFARRASSELTAQWLDSYRWLAGVLRGEGFDAAGEAAPDKYAGNPMALFHAHVNHAIAAAVFGDLAGLTRHTAAAMPLLPVVPGIYPTAVARLLRGLALAGQARDSHGDERDALLSELEEVTRWLAARAADAPVNFLHLLRLVEAERAWTDGDFRAATIAFDAARREADQRRRPWHRALIDERAARFYLAHGVDHAGYHLLIEARGEYLAWGATAKVAQLDWAYPNLGLQPAATVGQNGDDLQRRATVTTGTLDLLGILSMSRALSSETSIDRLRARVVQVLSAMTGATGVHLSLWSEDRRDWLLPTPDGDDPGSISGPEDRVPMSVLRYTQRTGEPLVVGDATRDDRFVRDPYFSSLTCCSLLAVPVLSRGTLRAVLILENRLIRSAFTTERLDAVKLIAGQLAVSLDNAQLYNELTASRTRIIATADQTRRRLERDLHDGAQQRLISLVLRLRTVHTAVPPELADEVAALADEANGALDELRVLAHGIHPTILARGGLPAALRTLARRSPVPVDLDIRVEERLPEPVEVSTYYVVAEALANAAKHAHASAITITVEADSVDAILRFAIHDNGVGGADFTLGTGLLGLKDRVEALGGRISLNSPRGAGTTLCGELPLTDTSPR